MLALLLSVGLLLGPLFADYSEHRTRPPEAETLFGFQSNDQVPPGARVLGTATAGPDSTGAVVTLIAYFLRDQSSPGVDLGHVGAVAIRDIGGQSQTFRLGDDLGEAPYAELAARDLTGDGTTALAVFGGVGAHSSVLRIYHWSGTGYDLIGDFFGDSGIVLKDTDGDGRDEVIVGVRNYDRSQLRLDSTLAWNGASYQPIAHRWGFTFDPESFDYPEAIVLRYYLAIAARDYRTAWSLLGPPMQRGQSYSAFEQGFASTRDLRVEDIEVTREDARSAGVRVEIVSLEADGRQLRFAGNWQVERVGADWRLMGAYVTPV